MERTECQELSPSKINNESYSEKKRLADIRNYEGRIRLNSRKMKCH